MAAKQETKNQFLKHRATNLRHIAHRKQEPIGSFDFKYLNVNNIGLTEFGVTS